MGKDVGRACRASEYAMRLWSDDDLADLPPGRARARAWVDLRDLELQSLSGHALQEWRGLRMALRERGPDGLPQFDDPEVPFLQLDSLFLKVSGYGWIKVVSYQDDDDCCLLAQRLAEAPSLREDGIFRPDGLRVAPLGAIERVSTTRSTCGNIDSLEFLIDGALVILVAAEAYEDHDGSLHFVRGDESIFLFTDRQALDSLRWRSVS